MANQKYYSLDTEMAAPYVNSYNIIILVVKTATYNKSMIGLSYES